MVPVVAHKFALEFTLTSTDYDAPLSFVLYHNDTIIYNGSHITEPVDINIVLECHSLEQQLSWQMDGKTSEHTQIDTLGNIVNDAALITENFKLDGFELKTLLTDHCVYLHDHNGSTDITENTYDNYMGCNGKVVFDFSSPAHIWILKNW